MVAPISLLLVRHMDTIRDGPDPYLSEKGQQQLKNLLAVLEKFPISSVYSSDLWRAVEPAQAIARQFGAPHRTLPALHEIRTGQEFPRPRSVLSPPTQENAEAEEIAAFEARVAKAIDQIVADNNGSHIALVTHSGTIRATLRHLLTLPLSLFDLPSIAPGSLVILTRDSSGIWRSQT